MRVSCVVKNSHWLLEVQRVVYQTHQQLHTWDTGDSNEDDTHHPHIAKEAKTLTVFLPGTWYESKVYISSLKPSNLAGLG